MMNIIFCHSPKAIYMAAEVYLNGGGSLGSISLWLGSTTHRTGKITAYHDGISEQVGHDLQNWHDTPGQYIECTCKTTKYIASKQAEDKAGTKRMGQPISYQKLSMA